MDLRLAACGFAVWLAMSGCDGSATQTTTGKGIEGILVDTHGNPVNGATVRAWPSGYGPIRGAQDSGSAVSVRTDEKGQYAISDLEVGLYNLIGANPSDRATVLIPRVRYLEQATDLGTDTLTAPGAIQGQFRVDGGDAPLAFCYLEGSGYAVISDSAGRFLLPNLAAGRYRLNYFAPGYAGAVDSVVMVNPGDTTFLAAKSLEPDLALLPLPPQGVSATYDSVYGLVHLSWHPVHVEGFKEYAIEAEDSVSENKPGLTLNWTVKDTSFEDQAMRYIGIYGANSAPFTRKYWVRTRDAEGNLSAKHGQPVKIRFADPTIINTEFTMHAVLDTSARAGCLDTVAFALDVISSPDSRVRIQWRALGLYHNSQTLPGGPDANIIRDSIRVTMGAPSRDTLILTPRTLEDLGASGSGVGWDSVFVSAMLLNQGTLIHAITVPVHLDSLGCFHASPATEKSNYKAPF